LSAKHTALVTISAATKELRVASILASTRNLIADIVEEVVTSPPTAVLELR
jgi:hypothetical protein